MQNRITPRTAPSTPLARRAVAALASLSLLASMAPLPARAAFVGTEQVLHADGAAHAHIHAWLARADVRAQLLRNGVDLAQVQARVDALTDAEARDFADRIDHAPAGGDILGLLFAVFVILLVLFAFFGRGRYYAR